MITGYIVATFFFVERAIERRGPHRLYVVLALRFQPAPPQSWKRIKARTVSFTTLATLPNFSRIQFWFTPPASSRPKSELCF